MLAALMKILGITGIILICLLCLILVSLLLVLFWPVVYKIDAHRDDSGTGLAVRARWLLGLVRVSFLYPDPGQLKANLLFFTIYDSGKETKPKEPKDKGKPATDSDSGSRSRKRGARANRQSDGEADWKYESLAVPGGQDAKTDQSAIGEQKPAGDTKGQAKGRTNGESAENVGKSSPEENRGASGGIFDLINRKIAQIKFTILKICDRIKDILENLSYYRDLLEEETTRLLFGQVWTRVLRIIRCLRPRKLTGSVSFGTGSPDTTGYILGLYCMLSPFLGQNMNIVPNFEEAVLTGELHATGRITVFILLTNGVGMLLDKNLREFIRKMKREDR